MVWHLVSPLHFCFYFQIPTLFFCLPNTFSSIRVMLRCKQSISCPLLHIKGFRWTSRRLLVWSSCWKCVYVLSWKLIYTTRYGNILHKCISGSVLKFARRNRTSRNRHSEMNNSNTSARLFTLGHCVVGKHLHHGSRAWMTAFALGSVLHKYPHL